VVPRRSRDAWVPRTDHPNRGPGFAHRAMSCAGEERGRHSTNPMHCQGEGSKSYENSARSGVHRPRALADEMRPWEGFAFRSAARPISVDCLGAQSARLPPRAPLPPSPKCRRIRGRQVGAGRARQRRFCQAAIVPGGRPFVCCLRQTLARGSAGRPEHRRRQRGHLRPRCSLKLS